MDLLSIFRLLARHKALVLILGLLSLVGTVALAVAAPPLFRASGTLVLVPPPRLPDNASAEEMQKAQNYLAEYGDLSVVVDAVRRVMVGEDTHKSLLQRGLKGTYTVAGNIDFARGPFIDVAVESPTAADAMNDAKLVMTDVNNQLVKMQTDYGTDPKYMITTSVIASPTQATRVLTSTIRRLIAALGLGTGLVLGSALLADAIGKRRKGGRQRVAEPAPAPAPAPPPIAAAMARAVPEPDDYESGLDAEEEYGAVPPAAARSVAAPRGVPSVVRRSGEPAEGLPNRRRAGRSLPSDVRRSV